ncbi:hypothetical protein OAM11_04155 [Candidatus Pelagibacter sp.]|nr:hypothetical protein [Candidatus Pelagibacter sp.]
MSKEKLYIFDTTLRDGAQTQGVDFSIDDKEKISNSLDNLGVDYIEGGWPGANPTDTEFFNKDHGFKNAKLTAFGMTKKYHDPNPMKKSFGAKVVVTLSNGKKITEQLDRADAHPYGTRPFKRQNYINKFLTLTDGIIDKRESDRFLKIVQNLKNLKSGQLDKLNIVIKKSNLKRNLKKGIF